MKIVIFDDHHATLDALNNFFSKITIYKVVGAFTKSNDLLHFLKTDSADIIITDLLTDEELGIELIPLLRKNAPDASIIVYSAITLDFIYNNCIEAGADFCIRKTEHLDILNDAVQKLYNDKKEKTEPPIKSKNYTLKLTAKERSIINYITEGMSSPEIAEKLGLSPNTINNQKNHMIKKFGCNTTAELVAKLFRQGFLKV